MSSKELDNLVRTGTLKAEPADQKEFDGLVDSGRKRLADAHLEGLSLDGQFTLAYEAAAHAFSLAAMRWHGYRPDKKRYVVFQALQYTATGPRGLAVTNPTLTALEAAAPSGRRLATASPAP